MAIEKTTARNTTSTAVRAPKIVRDMHVEALHRRAPVVAGGRLALRAGSGPAASW